MPPTTCWSDLAGLRVGVWGLGVEGRANLRRLALLGVEPVVVDDRAGEGVTATADGGYELLLGCDVVVKTPGLSRYREDVARLEASGVPVRGGLGLWLEDVDRSRVLALTGTKGKSTTTSIVGGLLRGLGHRVLTGGNLGVPPWDPEVGTDYDWWVVETSSYQATDVTTGPPVVVVTSLSQDHLDWHGGPEQYYRDKLSLCTRPGVETVVADGGSGSLRAHAELLGEHVRWVDGEPGGWVDGLRLLGAHNVRNAQLAQAALQALGVDGAGDEDRLAAACAEFTPLASRLHLLGEVDGVDFVDDCLSTNVLPTLAAVAAFPGRRVALLVGGFDRGIDYAPLAEGLAGRQDVLVLTLPDNGRAIGAVVRERGTEVVDCDDLEQAVAQGRAWAGRGGVVLLSPAAPSFGRYADYRAKSAAFAEAMRS
ncbi:MAG: UDP-N-acetylmuramoyl-L-alanine--D-glutamate ligase [Frankiales bacterium]|nr:UDP-N-acetylmuramoyl-L-alanine--D-glutamate ligase [Frankiales bacterium]